MTLGRGHSEMTYFEKQDFQNPLPFTIIITNT